MSLLYTIYNKTLDGNPKKAEYVKALEKEMEDNISKYETFVSSLESTEAEMSDETQDVNTTEALAERGRD